MRVHVTDLQIGDRLASNVFNAFGLHIFSTDKELDADAINLLIRHNVEYVDILMRRTYDASSDHSSATSGEYALPQFDNAVNGIKILFEKVSTGEYVEEHIVDQSFEPLIRQILKEKDVVSLLLALTNQDEYTYQHSVQVGVLSSYLASWVGLSPSMTMLAGKAGYLHDIGKSKIDPAILHKPSRLTEDEYELVKRHTTIGYDILREWFKDNPVLSIVALQHHERMNGSGYPHGLRGDQIDQLSRIVAIADIYSAMISSRVYQKKRDLLFVLRELHRMSFAELDPSMTHTFIRKMAPHFVGKKLVLTNGDTGNIVMINQHDVFRPLIRIDEQYIDLSRNHHLIVEAIFV